MRKAFTAFSILIALTTASLAQNESLLIGPGDLVHVQVFDTPEMDQRVRVTDAGTIPLVFLGDVKVVGMRPADASHLIERALVNKQYMLHPQVTTTVEQYATQTVAVMGQVTNPGSYPITTAQSIIKVLSLAGGLTDSADRNITISRHSDPGQKLNYYLSNQAGKALNDDVLVYPGDTVLVPNAAVIYVLGDVARPGGFPINTNDSQITVLRAIAMAGSTNKSAVVSKIRLIRKTDGGQTEIPVQLSAIQKGKQADFPLQPNDILYVPFSFAKNVLVNGSGIAAAAASAAVYR
jgi:polysaccharide export outer membrane protein